jgi:hypothetical protein
MRLEEEIARLIGRETPNDKSTHSSSSVDISPPHVDSVDTFSFLEF